MPFDMNIYLLAILSIFLKQLYQQLNRNHNKQTILPVGEKPMATHLLLGRSSRATILKSTKFPLLLHMTTDSHVVSGQALKQPKPGSHRGRSEGDFMKRNQSVYFLYS